MGLLHVWCVSAFRMYVSHYVHLIGSMLYVTYFSVSEAVAVSTMIQVVGHPHNHPNHEPVSDSSLIVA